MTDVTLGSMLEPVVYRFLISSRDKSLSMSIRRHDMHAITCRYSENVIQEISSRDHKNNVMLI